MPASWARDYAAGHFSTGLHVRLQIYIGIVYFIHCCAQTSIYVVARPSKFYAYKDGSLIS